MSVLYAHIAEKLQIIEDSKHAKGSMFEKFSKHLLLQKDTAGEYKEIFLWNDWELRDGGDTGIDLVIETQDENHNKSFIAVQCKFRQDSISLSDLSTFLTKLQSGVKDIRFSQGIIITTADLTKTATKEIEQIRKNIPINLITAQDIITSNVDWERFDPTKFDPAKDEIPQSQKSPRQHQKEAIESAKAYFADPKHTRGKLIMACGTGKTYTALKIAESLLADTCTKPSIALVGQTFREFCAQRSEPFIASIVCSDRKSAQDDEMNASELPFAPSTNSEDILKAYQKAKDANKPFIIFSTYQSSERIQEAQTQGLGEIDLMICDEAHRSVGAMYSQDGHIDDMGGGGAECIYNLS